MNLSADYFKATRRNLPNVIASAKAALAVGIVIQPQRGKRSFMLAWNDLPNRPRLDPKKDFISERGECFNLGMVIAADAKDDAPNAVGDVDLHSVRDQKDREDCAAAVKKLFGDLAPSVITGAGGGHYHLRFSAADLAEIFASGDKVILDYEGKAEGKPYNRPRGEPPPRWAIELFGPGHGATLPPSIHPETLKPYCWERQSPHTQPAPEVLIAAAKTASPELESREWGPRGNLGAAKLPSVLSLDPWLVPEPFREWVVDEAARMPCAPDLIAVSVIVYTGSVIGASCVLRPKGNDTWIVPAILWGLLIGPPGDMKSPAMAAAARPLMALTAEARAQYEKEMLAYGAEKLKYDARMATLEEALKKTARSDSVEGLNRAAEQIADLKAHAPKEPVHRRFETHDTTVEKFLDLLCDNHRGMMHRLDEATRLFFGFERPEHAGDRSTYLEGFNALYPRTIDRIKRGTRHVPHNCITLFGGIQPDAYAKWADVATDIGKNDGFLPRFGLMIYPDATLWGWVNKGPIPGAYERVLEIFRKLAYSDPATFGAIRGDKEEFPAFRFSPAAQEIFIQWLTELRAVRIPRESDPLIRQHLSKSDRMFCSLALVFHLIDRADYEILHGAGIDADGTVQYGFPGGGGEVSEDCVRRAAAWIEYLWSHMRRCYAVIGNHRIRGANLLAEKIMHGELRDGFSKRDIYRPQWAGLRGQEEVKSAIEWLESENWIRRAPRGVGAKGGRPTERYEIHPELLAGHKENTGD